MPRALFRGGFSEELQRDAAGAATQSAATRRRANGGVKAGPTSKCFWPEKGPSKEAPFVVPTLNPNHRVVVSRQMAARLLQFASQRQRSRRPAGAAVPVNLGMEGLDGP